MSINNIVRWETVLPYRSPIDIIVRKVFMPDTYTWDFVESEAIPSVC